MQDIEYAPEVGAALAVIGIGAFLTKIGGIAQIIPSLGTALAAIGGPVTLVIAAIAALVVGLVNLWNTNEGFRNAVIGAWDSLKETASNVFGAIAGFFTETIPNALQGMIARFQSLPEKIGAAFTSTSDAIAAWGESVSAWFTETIPAIIEAVVTFFSELPEKIGYAIGFALGKFTEWNLSVLDWITTNVPLAIKAIVDFFAALPQKIYDAIKSAVDKLSEWAGNVLNWITTNVPKAISAIIGFYASIPKKIYEVISGAISVIATWASDMIGKAKTEVPKVVSSIATFFEELPKKMLDIGKHIVTGIWEGITGAAGWLGDKISGFVDGVVSGFEDGFDINSPSKVMADLAKWIPAGIAVGIEDNAGVANTAMNDLVSSLTGVDFNVSGSASYSIPSITQDAVTAPTRDYVSALRQTTGVDLSEVQSIISNSLSGLSGSNSNITVTMPVYLDSRKIYEGQQRVSTIKGKNLVTT